MLLVFFLFGFLLLGLAVEAQDDPPGFISLDCGLPEGSTYIDTTTGIQYSSDSGFISSGERKTIQPEYAINSLGQFQSLRSFPQGIRNCYILRPAQGKGHKYLIRATFLYGNYDSINRLPQFDLHLGVDFWDTVAIGNASIPLGFEMVHLASSNDIHVCLVKTGLDFPFISTLELRPLNSSSIYTPQSGSLELYTRVYFTKLPALSIRYKDDISDRIWNPFQLTNTTALPAAPEIRFNEFLLPPIAMSTPNTPLFNNFLSFRWTPVNISDRFYVYLHFVEVVKLQANESRKFNIYINGDLWNTDGPVVPAYLSTTTVYSTSPETVSSIYRVTINQTSDSTLPPIISGLEIYNVRDILHLETDESEVAAMLSIQSTYGVVRNWQGDPCLPEDLIWDGVVCSYSALNSPRIISLNLSSSGLTGVISHSVFNLTKIETLDLSYNNLTGAVPDFLAGLPALKVLNMEGNNFTGFVPAQLLEKSRNGLLTMSLDPSNRPCDQSVPCKRKKKRTSVVVPVVASVVAAAIFVTLAALGIMWTIRRRNKRASKPLSRGDSLAREEEQDI